MKSLPIGFAKTHKYLVTEADFPAFVGQVVHPVCSTYTLAREMEWAGRRVLLALVEELEDGIGTAVEVKHVSPAFVDDELMITATLSKLEKNYVEVSVQVHVADRVISTGYTGQKVVLKSKLAQLFGPRK